MSLDFILLGLLREPSNGYSLKIWFERAFRHFWAAEPSQIYRTLARLEDAGLASVKEEESPKGPPQRIYRITAAGRRALRAWLRDGPSMSDTRQSQLAQVLFLSEIAPPDRVRFLDQLRDEYQVKLKELEAVKQSAPDAADPDEPCDDDEFFRRLTLDAGIHQYKSWIRWIDRVRAQHSARLLANQSQK